MEIGPINRLMDLMIMRKYNRYIIQLLFKLPAIAGIKDLGNKDTRTSREAPFRLRLPIP